MYPAWLPLPSGYGPVIVPDPVTNALGCTVTGWRALALIRSAGRVWFPAVAVIAARVAEQLPAAVIATLPQFNPKSNPSSQTTAAPVYGCTVCPPPPMVAHLGVRPVVLAPAYGGVVLISLVVLAAAYGGVVLCRLVVLAPAYGGVIVFGGVVHAPGDGGIVPTLSSRCLPANG